MKAKDSAHLQGEVDAGRRPLRPWNAGGMSAQLWSEFSAWFQTGSCRFDVVINESGEALVWLLTSHEAWLVGYCVLRDWNSEPLQQDS